MNSAKIRWLDSGMPYSEDYNDLYFSENNPIEESRHVFLRGNDLDSRWVSLKNENFIIAELGFGFGLNFVLSIELWHRTAAPQKRLHYIAFEKAPPTAEQFDRLYTKFPSLTHISRKLRERLPAFSDGCHRIEFGKAITLDLHYGDISKTLKLLDQDERAIDAWFLDGFSPSLNSALWNDSICELIGFYSSKDTTLSSYSSAGHFRRTLQKNGFLTKREPGFGVKRHMTTASYGDTSRKKQNSFKEKPRTQKVVGIIGAGLAGCSAAYSLAKRGFEVKIFDSSHEMAKQASSIPLLAVRPRLFQSESPVAEYFLHSFLFATAQFEYLSKTADIGWENTGVIQLEGALNKRKPIDLKKVSSIYPDDVLKVFSSKHSETLSSIKLSESGIIFARGGIINPQKLCSFYLNFPQISAHLNTKVLGLKRINEKWHLFSEENKSINQVDIVVLANSFWLNEFTQAKQLPLIKTFGTVNWFSSTELSKPLKTVICGKRTIFPLNRNEPNSHLVAASYSNGEEVMPIARATEENYSGAAQNFKQSNILENNSHAHESGVRCTTPDRAPIIGELSNYKIASKELNYLSKNAQKPLAISKDCYWPDLYVSAAHGSNGAATCPFSAEILASMISRDPLPINRNILPSIASLRFLIRELKKQRH